MYKKAQSAVLCSAYAMAAVLLSGCAGQPLLPAAIEPAQTYENAMDYTVTLKGDIDDDLRALLNEASELVTLNDRPPLGHAGLRQRGQQDMGRFQSVLYAESYYAAEVSFEIRSDPLPAEVVVRVETGPVFLLEDYAVRYVDVPDGTGEEAFPSDLETLGLHIGMSARSATIVQAQKNLLKKLENIGWPFATVRDRSVVVDHGRTTMRVAIDVNPGPFARFGEALISGNDEVELAYMQRLVPWQRGETYTKANLETYRARLASTGLFERVQVEPVYQLAEDGIVPVRVNVQERRHRSIGVGFGYSTDQGPSVDAFWENRNMWGRQEWLRVEANTSVNVQMISTDMRKPHYPVLDQHLLFNAKANRESSTAFDERSLFTFAGIERKKWDVWTFRGGPSLEYSSLYNRDSLERFNFALAGLPLSAGRDSTDDLLDPHRGSRLSFLATPYYGTLSSSVSFLSLEAAGSAYQAVDKAERVVFAERFRVGAVGGENTETLPANKRLYAGGGGSVRGYKHRMVGPLSDVNTPSGGRSVVELGLESRIKVTQTVGIVPFVEGGGIYNNLLPSFPDNTLWAGGLGLRYHTIVGPLRADLAFPINGRANVDSIFEFYISIGQAF